MRQGREVGRVNDTPALDFFDDVAGKVARCPPRPEVMPANDNASIGL